MYYQPILGTELKRKASLSCAQKQAREGQSEHLPRPHGVAFEHTDACITSAFSPATIATSPIDKTIQGESAAIVSCVSSRQGK